MKKLPTLNLLIFLSLVFTSGCQFNQASQPNNKISAEKTESTNINQPNPQKTITNQAENNFSNNKISDNEILQCRPEKIFKGEILTVTFAENHGGYLAILRVKDKKWFFLYEVENSNPVWSTEELKKLSEIKINTGNSINTTNSEKGEKIFSRSGVYRIMVSNEDFGQCDPIYQGFCEVYYENKNRTSR